MSEKRTVEIVDVKLHQPIGLLRLVTDTGIEGHCLGIRSDEGPMIVEHLKELVIGESPHFREKIWNAMVERVRSDRLGAPVWAKIDVALWDLFGKTVEFPVFRLTGGFRDAVPVCKDGTTHAPGDAAREAKRAIEEGFRAYRVRLGPEIREAIETATAVRDSVGPDVPLCAECSSTYEHVGALKIGRALDELEFRWIEDPFPSSDTQGLRALAEELDTPVFSTITGTEALSVGTQLLSAQAVDGLRVIPPQSGGITDCLKLAHIAESFGAHCEIGVTGGFEAFVAAQLVGAVKNSTFFTPPDTSARDTREEKGYEGVIKNLPAISDGRLQIQKGIGLGLELDWDEVERRTETVS